MGGFIIFHMKLKIKGNQTLAVRGLLDERFKVTLLDSTLSPSRS